ncbi:hypothetical protein MRB53_040910 [Persea americana]|nr:hypothetical protein MRB53_040910 [Persea americana]
MLTQKAVPALLICAVVKAALEEARTSDEYCRKIATEKFKHFTENSATCIESDKARIIVPDGTYTYEMWFECLDCRPRVPRPLFGTNVVYKVTCPIEEDMWPFLTLGVSTRNTMQSSYKSFDDHRPKKVIFREKIICRFVDRTREEKLLQSHERLHDMFSRKYLTYEQIFVYDAAWKKCSISLLAKPGRSSKISMAEVNPCTAPGLLSRAVPLQLKTLCLQVASARVLVMFLIRTVLAQQILRNLANYLTTYKTSC